MTLALAASMFVPAAVAAGQTSDVAAAKRPARHRYRRPSIDDQIKTLAKNLDLNQNQQAQVKSILERRQVQRRRIWSSPGLSGSRIDSYRALDDSTVVQIRAVLNDEQKKKYDPLAHRQNQPTSPQPFVEDWLKATTKHK